MPTIACDACRLRKVKCRWLNESDTACVFCSSIGIPCHTAPRQRQRAKTTARSKANTAQPPTLPRSSSSLLASGSAAPNASSHAASPPWLRKRQRRQTHTSQGARLLGVPGLTRQALDSCVETFFETVGQVFSLSQSQAVFVRRMRVQLYYSSGLDVPAELADIAHEPASRLLILAVACRGAFFSPYAALADDLYCHCAQILSDTDVITTDYLDAIDSILLLSELTIQPRHATATELDPLGKGTVVDIALYHGLHIAPSPSSPDFQRRLALFTRIWVHDAVRSASAHTCYRITDDDLGWPIPTDRDDLPYVPLTLATRKICATLLSPRAKGLGIGDDVVETALNTLSGVRGKMKVNLDILNACLAPGATPDNVPLYPTNTGVPLKPMEQLFMLSTHNWLYLVVWAAVQDAAERHPGKLSVSALANTEAAAVAACEDMAVLTQVSTSHGLHLRGPRSIRNHMAAFALFLVRVFTSIPNPTVEQSSRYFALAETLNYGVRSVTFYPDSDTLANTIRMTLYRATRIGSKDAARVAERGLAGLPGDMVDQSPSQPAGSGVDPESSTSTTASAQQPDTMFMSPLTSNGLVVSGEFFDTYESAALTSKDITPTFSNSLDSVLPSSAASNPSSRSPSVSLDWAELMETLKGCGFELPLGPL